MKRSDMIELRSLVAEAKKSVGGWGTTDADIYRQEGREALADDIEFVLDRVEITEEDVVLCAGATLPPHAVGSNPLQPDYHGGSYGCSACSAHNDWHGITG